MRRKWSHLESKMISATSFCLLIALCTIAVCEGRSRTAQRRKDGPSRTSYLPSPSAETFTGWTAPGGVARSEERTEGKSLVKRLIPENSEPDLDEISHQGVIGKAGVDFPAFPRIPNTGFTCKNVPTGYYADLETDCQVFHICDTSRKISFLCPNGTIFSQSHLICDWWFKVDCASAPTLYQSSAEYYSNEQKKTIKLSNRLTKNQDLQQITDVNSQSFRRTTPKDVPISTTTEKFHHRFRPDNSFSSSYRGPLKATMRSFQTLISEPTFNPTLHTPTINTNFEKQHNMIQLVGNNFQAVRTTLPTDNDASTYRSTIVKENHNNFKEMQIAAETASFTNNNHNNNRQFIQEYNNKNYHQFPPFSPTVNAKLKKGAPTQSTLTTLFVHDITDKIPNPFTNVYQEITTKRSTLVPYTKNYGNTENEKHQPYTRPGVSLLKNYIDKEKSRSALNSNTEDRLEKENLQSTTKLPTTRNDSFSTFAASSEKFNTYSNENLYQLSTEPTYQERRERLMRKLNLDNISPTEPTITTERTEKYSDRPSRPGLIVPPSLTPKTLHNLAIYYATGLDNTEATIPPQEDVESTTPVDEAVDVHSSLPALFSKQTINKYSNIFKPGADNQELLQEMKLDPNITNEIMEDLMLQQSQNGLSSSPQIRELAQVFTHALSAYLQDPVRFRKVLSDIRPTHPSFSDMITTASPNTDITTAHSNAESTRSNEEDEEILGFSDENKERPALAGFRDSKGLKIPEVYSRFNDLSSATTSKVFNRDVTTPSSVTPTSTPVPSTTPRIPFRCCAARISASYTTAAPSQAITTSASYKNNFARNINTSPNEKEIVIVTENSYAVSKYGGFQNNTDIYNSSPYGKDVKIAGTKPLGEKDYIKATNLPSAWGDDNTLKVSLLPTTNSHTNEYDTNNFGTPSTVLISTTTPQYASETESLELENDEELQRAHSQSFIAPQNNVERHEKNSNHEKEAIKKPSEELEAPTLPDNYNLTTIQTTTSVPLTTNEDATEIYSTASDDYFTSPGNDKTTNQYPWSSNFDNWHSTVVLDPITVNDGLSPTADALNLPFPNSGSGWEFNSNNVATTQTDTTGSSNENRHTYEPVHSSSQTLLQTTTSSNIDAIDNNQREGRQLKIDLNTEIPADSTTISDNVVEKAKEIMGGMNSTTTEKLINVMKKTKSKMVRRLILLLVQTCDDDNSTAEASKRALLEALMAVSEKDMDELVKAETIGPDLTETTPNYNVRFTNSHRRMDRVSEGSEILTENSLKINSRSGKSLNLDATDINYLSNPTTTETISSRSTFTATETFIPNTVTKEFAKSTTVSAINRDYKNLEISSSTTESKTPIAPTSGPIAEARIANNDKTNSDTRAIELLKSLYTIAARWG